MLPESYLPGNLTRSCAFYVLKPIIGVAADAFPKARKFIFLMTLTILYIGSCSICFLPPMYKQVVMNGQSLPVRNEQIGDKVESVNKVKMLLSSTLKDSCYVSEAWDCMVPCVSDGNQTLVNIKHIVLGEGSSIETMKNESQPVLIYELKGTEQETCDPYNQLRFDCKGGVYLGDDCPSLLSVWTFWIYVFLYVSVQITFATSNSITDAICMDCIGDNGKYGAQRAWGTVGWGVLAPISGLLIDLWSGEDYSKNYIPVALIIMILGLADLTVTSSKLKVPRTVSEGKVWKSVFRVLKQPHVLLFLGFVILNGFFDGSLLIYLFVLQEEMARDTVYMRYIKLIQGASLAAQCSLEAPFMWVFNWFYKRLGAIGITKLVFFIYTIRLFLLALIGSYGPVWATLICELLNGPCYGLGFTAIVVQAANITPSGTSATIQSIVNICYETIGYGVCNIIGALIYHKFGARRIYYVIGVIGVVTFLSYLVCSKFMDQLNYSVTTKDAKPNKESTTRCTQIPKENQSSHNEDIETRIPVQKGAANGEVKIADHAII